MFDATLGRFLQRDPQGTAAGVNVYQYAGGNPTCARDPTGLAWTKEQLLANLKKCDADTDIWALAIKANGGKEPTVVAGEGGATDLKKGEITLGKELDVCMATQQFIFELSNLSRKEDFDKLDARCEAGDVGREDYVKGLVKIEYENALKNAIKAFEACKGKDKWNCPTCRYEHTKKAKDFEDLFKNYYSNQAKESYGEWWDDNCKKAYQKKAPPAKK
jgi:hypothetical protein